ncbi:O-antigen ligase family protein [Luteococcus japonicus]|uniref:Ly involved in polysaccharide synthesis n=1 Tax=Luteococcus japonicus LSP_Lj1 TaxID=1255658 RepID=A0A1R4IKF7_9ACTN|nr:O-antigen ligase family protein [Luteococcus japonicus]SJN20382.1 ly involved in polysaccharide synthesis [Luteococcus japonicus LSP_Lj1]
MQLSTHSPDETLAGRDLSMLLAVSAFMITARVPMGFVLLALGPMVLIVIRGLRRHTGLELAPLRALVGSMLACGLLGGLVHGQLASTGSSLAVAITVALVAAGALFTGTPRRGAERLLDGSMAGLLFHWAVSMGEAITGFKLLPIMYPGANTIQHVTTHRFFVTSLYPNYNDYSVSMTLLVCLVLAQMLFRTRVHPLLKLGRLVVLLTAIFEVAYMGSRGCLAAMVVVALVLLVQSIRAVRPGAIGVRIVTLALLMAVAVVIGVVSSPWLADNSAAQRGVIAGRIRDLLVANPLAALVGHGSYAGYQAAADAAYPNALMDPHNLLLEIIVVFGIPTLLAYLACWWTVVRHDVLGRDGLRDWRSVALGTIVAVYPLIGVVTSSTLRYYLAWLFLVVALGRRAALRREERRSSEEERTTGRRSSY